MLSHFIWVYPVCKVNHFHSCHFNPVALRKAKIVYNFGLSECNRIKGLKYFSPNVSYVILTFSAASELCQVTSQAAGLILICVLITMTDEPISKIVKNNNCIS